jgi:uncharacterized protein (DUF433 family)
MMQSVISEHIESTPGICGGRPRIAGHRIRVSDIIVWHERQGLSPEEIVTRFPQIGLADVYAALAYYHDHHDEVRQFMLEDEEFAEFIHANTPSKLVKKLMGKEPGGNVVPPG